MQSSTTPDLGYHMGKRQKKIEQLKVIQINVFKHCNALFNTFTRKYVPFAHVILTMLSSTHRFLGVHKLYQAKLAKLIIGV